MSVRTTVKSIQDIMRQDVGVDGDAQRLSQLCWMFFLKIIDDQDLELELLNFDYRSPIPDTLQWRTWAANPEGITGDALLEFINSTLFPQLKALPVSGPNANRCRVVRDVFEDAYNYMKSGQLMRQVINRISGVDFNDLAERKHFGDIYEQLLNDLQSAGNAGEYYTPRAVTAFMVDRIDPRPGETLFDPACGTGGFLTCAIRHMRDRYVKKVEDEQAMQASLHAVEKKQLPYMLCVTNMLLHSIEDPSFVRHDNTLARPYISYSQSDRVDIVLTNPPFGGREEDGIESNFPRHFQTRETADLFLALIIRLLKTGGRAAVVLPDGSLFGEGVKTRLKEHLLEECNLHTIVRLPNSVFKPYASIGTNLLFFEKGAPTREIWFYEHCVPAGQKAYSMTRPIRLEHLQGCVDWWGGAERQGRQETDVAWKVSLDDIKARNYNLDFKNPHTVAGDHSDPEELLEKLNAAEQQTARLRDQLKAILAEALLDEKRPTAKLSGGRAMNPERLLQHFERISKAPGAIPRLRRFILDLAVRGNLVEQDPNDAPAVELLKRMVQAKQQKGTQSSKGVKLQQLNDENGEMPFQIPSNWLWLRIGTLFEVAGGIQKTPLRAPKSNAFPYLGVGNVYRGRIDLTTVKEFELQDGELERWRLEAGDLLIIEGNGSLSEIGRCAVWNGEIESCVHQNHVIRCRPLDLQISSFVLQFLNSPTGMAIMQRLAITSSGLYSLSVGKIRQIEVPLPPLAEQYRIVARVDELMALCDQLEAQLTTTEADSRRLLEAVLHEALNQPLAAHRTNEVGSECIEKVSGAFPMVV